MIDTFGIIAGNGTYPFAVVQGARAAGVRRIVVAAFEEETRPELADQVDTIEWMRVGQLGRMIRFFEKNKVSACVMAGQIAPKNLFSLRPDLKAVLLLGKLRERNAETIFRAIGKELEKAGTKLLPANTFLEKEMAPAGYIAGPKPNKHDQEELAYGFRIAKEISRLDIGQTVIVKKGTVLAVEGFEGTDKAMLRGGELGRGNAVMVKVSKPNQDFRFDIPVIGTRTIQIAEEAGIRLIGLEEGGTLLLEREEMEALAKKHAIGVYGISSEII